MDSSAPATRVALHEVGSIARGRSRHRPRDDEILFGGEYPFIQTGDVKHAQLYLTEYTQTYNEAGLAQSKLWPPETLCITIAANIADTAILGISACFPDSVIAFTPDPDKSDLRFVKYCLDCFKLQVQAISHGTTQDNLSLRKLRSLRFRMPSLAAQQKIAAILTAYDDLIENNRQRIACLEKMAEEIYREWFVRLRFPGHEHMPVHKGVPEGWEAISLLELCRLKRGYDLPKQNVVPGPYPILGSTGISGWHNEYKSKAPVVTTGRSGSLGEVVWSDIPAWPLNTSLYVANPHGNSWNFIYYTLRSANLAQFNSGAGVPTLNRNHLSCIRMKKPRREAQSKFDEVIDPIREQVKALQDSSQVLAKTRDLLLNRLISGKLRVDDLDIQFPPSMQAPKAA